MKKILTLGLSVLLVMGLATAAMAGRIETSGEVDFDYFSRLWTGEKANYTLVELGLYNNIVINDNVAINVNFWYESDQTQVQSYNVLDDAYVTYKFGNGNSFLVGKTRYWQLQGPADSLAPFVRAAFGGDDMLEPPVSLVGTFNLSDNFTLTAGYLFNAKNSNLCNGTSTATGTDAWGNPITVVISQPGNYDDANGYNIPFVRGSYSSGNLSTNLAVLKPSTNVSWITTDIATNYIFDVAYKFGKYSVWAAYLGVAQGLDNNYISGYSYDKNDQFGLFGATASIGNFWITVDYVFSAPDSQCYITKNDGSAIYKIVNWSEDKPFGFDISYYFGNNTTLKWTYATNTGNWKDNNRLRLIVKF